MTDQTPTPPPLDLAAVKKRLDCIPAKGESAMSGMAFPVSAVTELWNLRHIAREDVPALIARVEVAETAVFLLNASDARLNARAEAAEAKVAAVEALLARWERIQRMLAVVPGASMTPLGDVISDLRGTIAALDGTA